MKVVLSWVLGLALVGGVAARSKLWAKPNLSKVTFEVKGMTCDSCAKGLQASLAKVKGVKTAAVSFKDKQAVIQLNESQTPVQQLASEITQQGYTGSLIVRIKGMTCSACPEKVKTALEKVTGVSKAEVSLKENLARVSFAKKGSATVAQLKSAVEKAGYKVAVEPAIANTASASSYHVTPSRSREGCCAG